MPELPMAGRPGETRLQRADRLAKAAKLFRTVADEAIEENHRAYQRAQDAVQRWETAQYEADLAYAEWERSELGGRDGP